MSYPINAARRARACFGFTGWLAPIVSLGIAPALAQQSAAPDLPPVFVESPARRGTDTPVHRASHSPRTDRVRKPKAATADQSANGAPAANPAPTVVVSPTGTVTPGNQTASSVTVVTAQDI
jgi:vitamin B12 transporter